MLSNFPLKLEEETRKHNLNLKLLSNCPCSFPRGWWGKWERFPTPWSSTAWVAILPFLSHQVPRMTNSPLGQQWGGSEEKASTRTKRDSGEQLPSTFSVPDTARQAFYMCHMSHHPPITLGNIPPPLCRSWYLESLCSKMSELRAFHHNTHDGSPRSWAHRPCDLWARAAHSKVIISC